MSETMSDSVKAKIARLEGQSDSKRWHVERLRAWCWTQMCGEKLDDTGTAENGPGQAESMLLGQIVTMIDNDILKGWK